MYPWKYWICPKCGDMFKALSLPVLDLLKGLHEDKHRSQAASSSYQGDKLSLSLYDQNFLVSCGVKLD